MFSDENLQQLKRELNQRLETIGVWAPCLQSLIERLEAAELAVEQAYRCTAENREYYEAWKRSAGKEI